RAVDGRGEKGVLRMQRYLGGRGAIKIDRAPRAAEVLRGRGATGSEERGGEQQPAERRSVGNLFFHFNPGDQCGRWPDMASEVSPMFRRASRRQARTVAGLRVQSS